jgi:hypothetical protein
VRFFGATVAYEQIFRLETMGREDNLEEAETILAAVEAEMSKLLPALEQYVQSYRSDG